MAEVLPCGHGGDPGDGGYWIALYDILEQHGIRVALVNAQHTKNVPGRKADMQECQWLMKLHTYWLVRDLFRLQQDMEYARTIWRLRDRRVKNAGREIQQMQKALTQMEYPAGQRDQRHQRNQRAGNHRRRTQG